MNTPQTIAYVRRDEAPVLPPPRGTVGPAAWLRQNLFSGLGNTLLTIAVGLLLGLIAWTILDWAILKAIWTGADREACAIERAGACWPFVWAKFPQWMFGFYPIEERWRPWLVFLIGAAALTPMLIPSVRGKLPNALFLVFAYPVIALILLSGGNFDIPWPVYAAVAITAVVVAAFAREWRPAGGGVLFAGLLLLLEADFGLTHVETANWGGLLVTLVVSVAGIAASLPLGVLLALGRRSRMPIVRLLSVIFIELWRGVPLITVLFMASVMLPLFAPEGVTIDKLLRAVIGITLFSSAYMAEVVRGGLQAIGKGQYEGAMALGLSYWQMMWKIVLPQALKISIPNIVSNFIGLFKDTTLVLIVGIFDLLGMINAGTQDAKWASEQTGNTGYFVAAIIFWAFCFGMSRYAMFTETRLNAGARR